MAFRKRTSVEVNMVGRPQHKHALAIGNQKQISEGCRTLAYIPVVRILLYAHAAAGPEYEYPACLTMV